MSVIMPPGAGGCGCAVPGAEDPRPAAPGVQAAFPPGAAAAAGVNGAPRVYLRLQTGLLHHHPGDLLITVLQATLGCASDRLILLALVHLVHVGGCVRDCM